MSDGDVEAHEVLKAKPRRSGHLHDWAALAIAIVVGTAAILQQSCELTTTTFGILGFSVRGFLTRGG